MRTLRTLGAHIVAALLLMAAPAAGQDHNNAAGYGAGFLLPGAFNPGASGSELAMDAGWVATAFGEAWHVAGGRLGARLNGMFSQRPLQVGEENRDINTFAADASIIARLLSPTPGNAFAPFVSAGGGIVRYGLGRGMELDFPEAGVTYPGDDEIQWALVGGAGFDILPAGFRVGGNPLGIRVEVADHVVLRSPFRGTDGERLGPIHNIRAGISLIGLGWF
ncbi:MAG TPA: hypothetical protein VK929_06585 [Longimicrobiales bacterium]|nr:hypothetical protein [Longimicrobiales bacterium]